MPRACVRDLAVLRGYHRPVIIRERWRFEIEKFIVTYYPAKDSFHDLQLVHEELVKSLIRSLGSGSVGRYYVRQSLYIRQRQVAIFISNFLSF